MQGRRVAQPFALGARGQRPLVAVHRSLDALALNGVWQLNGGRVAAVRLVPIAKGGIRAVRRVGLPGGLAILLPLVIGFIDVNALGGFLAGAVVTGFLLAIYMANSGGAWDNAKKYIEAGAHGGKGTDAHAAAVVGDTIGDPFKDTSGPAMNILIKVMTIVSLVFVPAFI